MQAGSKKQRKNGASCEGRAVFFFRFRFHQPAGQGVCRTTMTRRPTQAHDISGDWQKNPGLGRANDTLFNVSERAAYETV
jgi:hypothetical protein